MSKTDRGNLTFCNSEPVLINRVLEWFFENWNIPYNDWKWYIRVNLPEQSQKVVEQVTKEVTAFWIANSPIEKEASYPKSVTFTKNSKRRTLTNNGSLIIERRETVFLQVMHSLVKTLFSRMPEQKPEHIAAFLRGLLAADSCINFRLASGHRRVFLTATKASDRQLIIRCCNKLGISTSECAKISNVIFSGRKDLFRMHELNLVSLHPAKYARFLEMLDSYQR